jgi:hypothetical protein
MEPYSKAFQKYQENAPIFLYTFIFILLTIFFIIQ